MRKYSTLPEDPTEIDGLAKSESYLILDFGGSILGLVRLVAIADMLQAALYWATLRPHCQVGDRIFGLPAKAVWSIKCLTFALSGGDLPNIPTASLYQKQYLAQEFAQNLAASIFLSN